MKTAPSPFPAIQFDTFSVSSQGIGEYLIYAEPQSGWKDHAEERAFLETLKTFPEHLVRSVHYQRVVDALRKTLEASRMTVAGKTTRPAEGITTGRPLMEALDAADQLLREIGEQS